MTPFLGDYLGYHHLPHHIEEVFLSVAFYQAVYHVSSFLSPKLCQGYKTLSRRTQLNFDIHVVSQVQAVLILVLAYPLFGDKTLAADRVYGYTSYAGFVNATGLGYFAWDIYICLKHLDMFGIGFAVHGIGAGFVFLQCMRPFLAYYQPHFLLFELSTPFLNVNWFASHLPAGSIPFKYQKINGIFLLASFFLVRIVWGFYQALRVANDVFLGAVVYERVHPLWASVGVVVSNLALDVLNVYWFYKMLRLAKRALAAGSGSAVAKKLTEKTDLTKKTE